jgi:class 3 adenylate cyclase
VDRPETQFVSVGDADLAYQVLGNGTSDLLFLVGLGANVELAWEDPAGASFLQRLASLRRLICFDRRGTGASDGVPRNAIPTWEEWTEDIGAVLDAVGSKRTAIVATVEGGPISILYAASHPERVDALILFNTAARYMVDDNYAVGASPEAIDALLELMRSHWGKPELYELINPGLADDHARLHFLARMARLSATPRTAAAQYGYVLRGVDVRPVLSLIPVPTLVLSADNRQVLPIEHGRYLADHIKGARFIALPGEDVYYGQHASALFEEIAEFLTGTRPVADVERVLATVLFTDIVNSTATAASLGDRKWKSMLDSHDRSVREQLQRFRGREIHTTGDGFMASFDGPARAIRGAEAIIEATKGLGIELRAGMHTGECEVRGDDLGGLAVHIAARVGALADPGEVLVSGTLKDLVVGSGIEFEDRGEHELRGVPGTWKLFAVRG